jgi:hypothetical protein
MAQPGPRVPPDGWRPGRPGDSALPVICQGPGPDSTRTTPAPSSTESPDEHRVPPPPLEVGGYALGVAAGTLLGVVLDARLSTGQSALRVVVPGDGKRSPGRCRTAGGR